MLNGNQLMGTKPILNDDDVKAIVDLKHQGFSYELISQKLFVTRQTLRNTLKRNGIKPESERTKICQFQINRVLSLRANGLSYRSIASKTGMGRHTIMKVIKGRYKLNHIQSGCDSLLDQCE